METEDQSLEICASRWIARRDRGLTPKEQDDFLQWLRDDPRHAAAIGRLEKAWTMLDVLSDWRPEHSVSPNPDLLAERAPPAKQPPRRPIVWLATALGAAAVVAVGVFVGMQQRASDPAVGSTPGIVRHEPERMTLPDGSIVDLNDGARVEVAFVPAERRVRLVGGEAHFSVSRNAERPFVVEASGVLVKAVGTAFSVRRGDANVAVLVTEGKVRVDWPYASADAGSTPGPEQTPLLLAGDRAVIDTTSRSSRPVVTHVSSQEMDRALAWQRPRLEFDDMPLAAIVEEFNRHNSHKLVVNDANTGELRIGGTFRADNVEAFVRLLESSFGVTAERNENVTTLICDR